MQEALQSQWTHHSKPVHTQKKHPSVQASDLKDLSGIDREWLNISFHFEGA